ncbi:transducin/WD40 repeat-like superfamily protein isoform X2 [Wolffia australiana]
MWRKPKKTDSVPKLIIEDIIGLTTKNANGFASDASAGVCAYLAGCAVVLYDVEVDRRAPLMVSSRVPKPLSCVALARQGRRIVAAGESAQAPAILLWDFSTGSLICELKGHQIRVQSIDFSPDGKTLVSLGHHNDGHICVWDWKSGKLSAKVKPSSTPYPLLSIKFVLEDNSFVTIGRKHLKLWSIKSLKSMGKDFHPLDSKSANLSSHKSRSFVSVASIFAAKPISKDTSRESISIYALTETGLLCEIDEGFTIKKYVDMEVEKAFSISLSEDLVACACSNGVVQLFQVRGLLYVGCVTYADPAVSFGHKNLPCKAESSEMLADHDIPKPDATACQFLSPSRLGVIYADHSFYIWDIDQIQKTSKCCVLVSHSGCIWDIKNLPARDLDPIGSAESDKVSCREVSFVTCSADGTVRQWDIALLTHLESSQDQKDLTQNEQITSFVDESSCSSVQLVSCGILDHENVDANLDDNAFRTMAVSSDGQYLAAGDLRGNLHIFNLQTSTYTCIKEAHRADILTVYFGIKGSCDKSHYLVTGSKDRTIHIYDSSRNFDLVESLEDHPSAVTSIILTSDDTKLISCGADRYLYFRDVHVSETGCRVSRRSNQSGHHSGIFDVAVEPAQKIAVTVNQDRKINKYNVSSGKLVGSIKEEADLGQPVKVLIDSTGSYIVCSYSNKSLRLYDFVTGEAIAQVMGHAEVITGCIFLPDCRHLITVSIDSCIFIWKLPPILSRKMSQKVKDRFSWDVEKSNKIVYPLEEDVSFEFSVSRLPKWAQTKVEREDVLVQGSDTNISPEIQQSVCSDLGIVEQMNQNFKNVHERSCQMASEPDGAGRVMEGNEVSRSSSFNKLEESLLVIGPLHGDKSSNESRLSSTNLEINAVGESSLKVLVAVDVHNHATKITSDDSFGQKRCNLSPTQPEVEFTGRKSLSGHFHSRRYQLSSCKRSVETLFNCGLQSLEDSPDQAVKRAKVAPRPDDNDQGEETDDVSNPSSAFSMKARDIPHNDDSNPIKGDGKEMNEFRTALEVIDKTAKQAIGICTRFETNAAESLRDEMLMQLKVSLPSISEKLETLAGFLKGEKFSFNSHGNKVLEVEPIVERFAGALSDRVLEMLKDKI